MRSKNSGFTLIELLVVIAILTILFVIVLLAINPAKIFAQANNVKYKSDVLNIYNAVTMYWADNGATLPPEIPVNTKPLAIATTGANICAKLLPKYLPQLPVDQVLGTLPINSCSNVHNTNYKIVADSSGNYIVYADSQIPAIAKGQLPGANPVLYYKFDEQAPQAINQVGPYGDSTYNNSTQVDGKYGSGFNFNATSFNYVEVPASPSISLNGINGETIEAWVKHGPNQNHILYNDNGKARRLHGPGFNAYDSLGNLRPLQFDTNVEDNKWHHVAYVFDGKKAITYVDGDLQTMQFTLPDGVSLRPATGFWWIGRSCTGADCNNFYTGLVDELKIYNYARTQAQINLDALIFDSN